MNTLETFLFPIITMAVVYRIKLSGEGLGRIERSDDFKVWLPEEVRRDRLWRRYRRPGRGTLPSRVFLRSSGYGGRGGVARGGQG